jgi:HSP20 family protein
MRELLGWDPFREMTPRLWRASADEGFFVPAFDLREAKDAYVFKADLPGFRQEDVEVQITGNRLTIAGRREAERAEDGDTYYCSERTYGEFTRTFTLPDDVNPDEVMAELKDGVLSVRVPKRPETQPKRVSVRGGESREAGRTGQMLGGSTRSEASSAQTTAGASGAETPGASPGRGSEDG